MITLAAAGWVLAAAAMALLWVWQYRTPDTDLADGAWPTLIAVLALVYARFGGGDVYRKAAVVSMMGSWGLRLSVYWLYGRVIGKAEADRAAVTPRRPGDEASRRLFWHFEARGASAALFSMPALVAASNPAPDFSSVELAAAGLWMVGFAGASTADRQRLRFYATPANAGLACRSGVWRYTARPDAVFEGIIWIALGLFALGSPWGWVAVVCPAVRIYQLIRDRRSLPPV